MSYLHKIYNKNFNKKFLNYYSFYNKNDFDFNMLDILPLHFKDKYLENISEIEKEISILDKESKYCDLYNRHNLLFESIVNTKIDGLALLAFKEIESNETIKSTLSSFNPTSSYAKKVTYNRSSTMTGRLTVEKGPRILTLPARCRSILKSRFKSGLIMSIDFKSLEPRIARNLYEITKCNDIYEEISKNLSFVADRSVIKKAVICTLYGSRQKYLDNLSRERSEEVFRVVNNYYNMSYILNLASNIDSFGIRRNYFGRPIWNIKENRSHVIANNYIQSTAVDLTLNYFTDFVVDMCCDDILPIFLIHDALIIDVNTERLDDIKEYIKKGYNHKELGNFPLELTPIMKDI